MDRLDTRFQFLSAHTKDALKREGQLVLQVRFESEKNHTLSSPLGFPWLCLLNPAGLLELPPRWWTSVQRCIFPGLPEASCQVKRETFPNPAVLSPTLATKVYVSEHRAHIILQNCQKAGITLYLAPVAKKYRKQ